MSRPVTLLLPEEAKGLEFDSVVVVEPAAIAGADRLGLRLLYVAMTRPIRRLAVVHAEPLPEALSPGQGGQAPGGGPPAGAIGQTDAIKRRGPNGR